jgi:Ca-activated chloride channel family protein
MNHIRRFIVASVISIIVISSFLGSVTAQSGRRPAERTTQDKNDALKLRAEEVLLNITVTDPYGKQATDLGKSEFIIAEDGQRQDLTSFIVSSVPINVVLMLDASGSVSGEIPALRDAALKFIEPLESSDTVSVMEFHTDVELIQDWTSSAEDLRRAISWRFRPGVVRTPEGRAVPGQTSLYDALYLAANEQLAKVEGRKAVIILTDGLDSSSKITYSQSMAAVVRSGAVVYVVSKARAFIAELNKYRGKAGKIFGGGMAGAADQYVAAFEAAEKVMEDICSRTGGRLFSPLKDSEMKDVYAAVARELKNQYIITYVPRNEERNGQLRRVNVYLTRPGYAARTRESYYAPTN